MNLYIKKTGMLAFLSICIVLTAFLSSGSDVTTIKSTSSTSKTSSITRTPSVSGDFTSGEMADGILDETDNVLVTTDAEAVAAVPETEGGGALSVSGSNLVNSEGDKIQLKGVSTHGINTFPQFVSYDTFKTVKSWGANAIRLAMYTSEDNGYCNGDDSNRTTLKETMYTGIDACTQLGMYAIVDWHILSDSNPLTYKDLAIDFFKEVSAKYKDNTNILYEICNEPNGSTTWADIKAYAAEVIPVIKANDPDAIIIVGTPSWSQEVDKALADPITDYSNIMYTLHFYADSHQDSLRNTLESAYTDGLPIMVTEFGICDSSGGGSNNIEQGNTWISLLDKYNISYFMWNLSNKAETCALISSSCDSTSDWNTTDLSEAGQWYLKVLGGTTGGNADDETTALDQQGNSSLKVTSTFVSNWKSGRSNSTQYTFTIQNTGNTVVDNWTITVKFASSVSLSQCWNGTGVASGDTITITSPEGGISIPVGGSLEDIGIIVISGQKAVISSATIR